VFGTRHVLLAGGGVTLLCATALLAVPAIRGLVRADVAPVRSVPVPTQEPARPRTG
ncbi:MFS transporter, partial [Streptomyces sp. SID14478]|nr:MFS transporter [Streptomyces sp. SID14478]